MLLDDKNMLCKNVAAATNGTNLIGDSIDLDVTGRSPGRGRPPLFLMVAVKGGADGSANIGGAGTSDYQLVSGTGVTGAGVINAGATTVASTGARPVAALNGDGVFAVPLTGRTLDRYVQLQVVNSAARANAVVNAGLVFDVDEYEAFADAQN